MQLRGFTLMELLIVLAIVGILMVSLTPTLLKARQVAEERTALAHAHNVLKAAWAHVAEDPGASPVGGDCTDGFTAGSYSVPDPGPGVASCQVAWTGQFFRVEVRSRSGRSFTLP
jgi:type IV pilus assembly protein PilA